MWVELYCFIILCSTIVNLTCDGDWKGHILENSLFPNLAGEIVSTA